MSEHPKPPPKSDDDFDPFASRFIIRRNRTHERRERIVQEVMANRRGEHRVPTWVLGLCLALMIAVCVGTLILY
jgi:hypothetical protein